MPKTLFDETTIANLRLKNRFIRAAMGEKTTDGHITPAIIELYKKYAENDIGTAITGYTLVSPTEKSFPLLAFYDETFAEDHKKLVETAHSHNMKLVLQLVYVGSSLPPGAEIDVALAPSAVPSVSNYGGKASAGVREITIDEIKTIQKNFADTALRAKNAGYDGVEIHSAHYFFLSQFLMPYYNRRTDIYGGSAENRARMVIETYETIRSAVGDDFPVWIKINSTDNLPIHTPFDDVLYLCKELAKRGIDAIEVSGDHHSHDGKSETSFFKKETEAIANAVDVAVIMTGGNKDFDEMTQILNTTKIGHFGMARALLIKPSQVKDWKGL
jgi:2,4-dienoyl-CoA reductase-like NADH-dependent reductase (Old Yellow Enzyme family)